MVPCEYHKLRVGDNGENNQLHINTTPNWTCWANAPSACAVLVHDAPMLGEKADGHLKFSKRRLQMEIYAERNI